MNTTTTIASNNSKTAAGVSDTADRLSNVADQTISKTRDVVNEKLDQTESAIHAARDRTGPILNRLSEQAEALKQRSAQALRQGQDYVRDVALKSSETTSAYVQRQPLKSVLLAAGAGALLAMIAGAALRRRTER